MSQTKYYVRLGTQLMGPFSLDQLKILKERGRLQPFHSISTDGRTWQPASSLTELFPPEPPPASANPAASVAPGAPLAVGPEQDAWYYLDANGQQAGPVPHAKLRDLMATGEILPTTYVWTAGLTEWKPLAEVLPGLGHLSAKKAWKLLAPNFKLLAWILGGVIGLVTVVAGIYFRQVVKERGNYDARTLFEQVFRGVPLLYSKGPIGEAHGSGFVISIQKRKGTRWFIVTNKHVVEGAQEVLGERMPFLPFQPKWNIFFFERADARTINIAPQDGLQVYAVHHKADLAIIECTPIKNWLEDRQVHVFRLGRRDLVLTPGTEVVVIGHPGTPGAEEFAPEPMTFTKGHIAGPEREIEGCRFYQLQVPIAPGNSGGPVLDMTGQVVGVVTLGNVLGNQGQFNYALHIKYLHEILDEIP